MAGIKALRQIQFAKEAVNGTYLISTALFRGTGTIEDMREVTFPDEDIGKLTGTDRSYISKLGGQLALDATSTFEQLPYILRTGIKEVSGVKDGAGTGYVYTYPIPYAAQTALEIATLAVEAGDNQEMERTTYAFTKEFTLSGQPGEAWKLSSTMETRDVDRNYLSASTLTVSASGSSIADSANGLAIFPAGSRVRIASALNSGIYPVLTSAGSALTLTGTVVNEVSAATVLDQMFTTVALPTVEDMLFSNSKLYIDAVGGSFGGTQKSNTFLGATLKYTTGLMAVPTGDGRLDFSFAKQANPEITLDITFEHDGVSTAEKANWKTQTVRKIEIKCEGSTLTTAGTTYSKKTMLIDLIGKWQKFNKIDEKDGNDIITATFIGRYDATAATAGQFVIVNALSALP